MRRPFSSLCLGLLALAVTAQAQQPAEFRAKPPELRQIDKWINSKPLTLARLRGQVVVLHFWTFG